MILVQLTDTHVLNPASTEERWVPNNEHLAEAVSLVVAEDPKPVAVMATGDLTNNAAPGELEELLRLLDPIDVPILALPGNHDDRGEIRRSFDMPWAAEDNLSWSVQLGDLHLIGLDTTVPGFHHGEFDHEREEWLRGALADTDGRPSAIAMHHPPFASGIGWMDRSMLRRADAFAEVVASHPNITRIFCGHLHRPIQTTIGSVTTTVGLSTVHHIGLNLAEGGPVELVRDPVGYQLHRFDGSSWISHTRYVATGEVPFTPSWAASMD